jgi:uncharacterized membrane protein YhaH (DUF805 family)
MRIDRARYLSLGLALLAVKCGIDAAISHWFGRPWTPRVYLNPIATPLFYTGEAPAFWLALWAAAIPFIAAGLFLTLRRLQDAAVSPWLCVFFFVPFINLLFFLALIVLRSGHGLQALASPPPRMSFGKALLLAGAGGAAVGGAACTLALFVFKQQGAALFIGAPPIGGFVAGFLFAKWHRPGLGGELLAALCSVILAAAVVIGFSLDGLVCVVMSLPLVLLGACCGAVAGCLASRSARAGGAAPASALLMLPLVMILEKAVPLPSAPAEPVSSSITVQAPAEAVWRRVIAFPPLPPPHEGIFRAGIAAPLEATIDEPGPGGTRRCRFTTGTFVEPITVWDPPRELRFAVSASPDPLTEWTLWRGPRPPHLDGALEAVEGQFLIEPLPDGRTRLIGRTWYRTGLAPESYWRLWADPILHTIHMRVLEHIAALAERDTAAAIDSGRPAGAGGTRGR